MHVLYSNFVVQSYKEMMEKTILFSQVNWSNSISCLKNKKLLQKIEIGQVFCRSREILTDINGSIIHLFL